MYGIYANIKGLYWWDPCYHIYQHHGSYMGYEAELIHSWSGKLWFFVVLLSCLVLPFRSRWWRIWVEQQPAASIPVRWRNRWRDAQASNQSIHGRKLEGWWLNRKMDRKKAHSRHNTVELYEVDLEGLYIYMPFGRILNCIFVCCVFPIC